MPVAYLESMLENVLENMDKCIETFARTGILFSVEAKTHGMRAFIGYQ